MCIRSSEAASVGVGLRAVASAAGSCTALEDGGFDRVLALPFWPMAR